MCTPNDAITNKVQDLMEIRKTIEELEAEAEAIVDEIKTYMGNEEVMLVGAWKITYKEAISHRLDTKRLKQVLGDALEGYYNAIISRPFKVS